jgi:hypothetical protein
MMLTHPNPQFLRAFREESLIARAAKVLFEPHSTNNRDARVRAKISTEAEKVAKRANQRKEKRHRSSAPFNHKTISNVF